MENETIRKEAKRLGVKHWQIADFIGVSEQTFMRRLRKELPSGQQEEILCAIRQLAQMQSAKGGA